MIEIIMVIVIAGMLALAFFPRTNLVGGYAPMAADVVASDIRLTQREAMRREAPLSITFTAGSSAYKYALDAPGNGETRNLAELGPNTTVAQRQTITFNSLGEPAALTIPLAITVTDGAATNTIRIEPYTGMVTVQ